MKLLLLILLVSCQTGQQTLTVEQCSPFLKFEEEADGREIVIVEDSACWCRKYFYGKNRIGPAVGESDPVRRPLQYCQNMIGNPPKDYAALSVFLESVRQRIIRSEVQ